jgi:hypothetical protein
MDGNFSAVHQKRSNAAPEKCLTDGHLYLVSDTNYVPYLESAKEHREVSCKTDDSHQYPSLFVSPRRAMNTTL